jgi:DNA recombination protein RmuC
MNASAPLAVKGKPKPSQDPPPCSAILHGVFIYFFVMLEILIFLAVLILLLVIVLLVMQRKVPERAAQVLEQQHRAMLSDLHDGLNKQSDRQAEHARADQELIQNSFRNATQHLSSNVELLAKTMDTRLEQISGKVAERLDEGFKKTNETFTNVMTRLATIDEAQKKIDGLTTNVVSLQHLLGDKRSRGAFGEVQLEGLVRNILPPDAYSFQQKLSNGNRVDCLLILPPPTGKVPVDAKFPLENYHRMLEQDLAESDKLIARKQFKLDIKKHIDDISQKYLIRNETSDGAVMFVPAEAVFAEIHAYHSDLVEYAMHQHIWIVSPTTLMAVLNTARAVMKDVQMREQVHIIQSELGKLSVDFKRFDERMKRLADNIRKANEEAGQVEISSRKISDHFAKIEAVEMQEDSAAPISVDKLQ